MSVTSADTKHALAILHQLAMMEVGPTRGNEELLAGLASIENSLHAVVDTPPATLSSLPLTPSVTTSAPNALPAPSPATPAITIGMSTDTLANLPAVDVLVPIASTPSSSPSSMLTPLSSPTHTQYNPKVNELEGSLWVSTPVVDNAVLSIPPESPLAGQARLEEACTSVCSDCNMEWHMFLPDWHLSYFS
ncbi:hypothetical protein EV401DRAFT_2077692 [Pisolithus croceorrhizus]|nr:hypothetical protein EV401DRAFT_2077692 [Pisolithus croceorrhizus]